MIPEQFAKQIPGILVDAFDVDIQLYLGNVLKRIRQTPGGTAFAEWATNHRILFEVIIRLISVAVQRIPNPDKNIVMNAVSDTLKKLPVEIRRAVLGDIPVWGSSPSKGVGENQNFYERYEEALEGLSDEELALVVELDSAKLREWVNSPTKIRPFLLKKLAEEEPQQEKRSVSAKAKAQIDSLNTSIEKWVDDIKKGKKRND